MITQRDLEDYHDDALEPGAMQRIAAELRRDPDLRRRLTKLQRTDDLVRDALTAPAARTTRPLRALYPLAAAATLLLALIGAWRFTSSPAPQPMQPPRAPDASYEPMRVVLSMPGRSDAPTPQAVHVQTSIEDKAPRPLSMSKAAVRRALAAMPVEAQLDACRDWAADARLRRFVFDYLRDLGEQEAFTEDVARLGAELSASPELATWVRSYLPPRQPRSDRNEESPTRA